MILICTIVLLVLCLVPTKKNYAYFNMIPGVWATNGQSQHICYCTGDTMTCICVWVGAETY